MALAPEDLMRILGVPPENLDCGGLKLHLWKVFRLIGKGKLGKDRKRLPPVDEVEPRNGVFKLDPGCYRIRYAEVVRVPANCVAIALPRSSLLRMGATIFSAVWDPGYEGRGEGMMIVANPFGVEIEVGAQVAQLVFISMARATARVYRGSYYRENMGEDI